MMKICFLLYMIVVEDIIAIIQIVHIGRETN
eukprot:UN10137